MPGVWHAARRSAEGPSLAGPAEYRNCEGLKKGTQTVKITLEPTTAIVELAERPNGPTIPARLWEGVTDCGVKVHCYITRVSVAPADTERFETEFSLEPQKAPSPELGPIPLRMVI